MTTVVIHRCPRCPRLGELAKGVAERLRGEATTVEVVDGQPDEFRVDVDDYNAYSLAGPTRPTADEVVATVRQISGSGGEGATENAAPRVGGGEGI